MNFSMKRVNAILQKDFKDFSRNMAVSVIIFLLPILAALSVRTGVNGIDFYYLLINMCFSMVFNS